MRLRCKNWRPIEKNTLKGIFDVEIELISDELSIILVGATYHEKNQSRWVSMPAKPYKNKSGEDSWANIVDWPDRFQRDRFNNIVLAQVDQLLKSQAPWES